MADYGGVGGGRSLRDALNQLYPMTGMGEYGAGYPPNMFPPGTGADQPTAPVPLPQPRPPGPGMAPGVGGMPPPGPTAPGTMGQAPALQGAPGLGGGIPPGQYGGPQSYAARLGIGGRF